MICAFKGLEELKDCVEKLEKDGCKIQPGKNLRACKLTQWAYDENGSDVEESWFYTLSCSELSGKVKVGGDCRGLSDLAAKFPSLKAEIILSVWNAQGTWDACFNVLSAKLADEKKLRVDNCGFLLDDILWPALEVGESNDANEWSVRELDTSLAGLELEIEKEKISEGWHVLDATDLSSKGNRTVESADSSKPTASYKDMVIRGEETAREIPALVPLPKPPVTTWQPKFQINAAPKRRIDKLYMGNVPSKTEERDEDFDSEYFESQVFLKGSVGLQRKLAVTKIRPRAMDQKLKRIAEKAKG